jgi:cobalt-zinc-cadmium efflux system outer membrane protein
MRITLCVTGALWLLVGSLAGQTPAEPARPSLTLADALAMARRASPALTAARQLLAAAKARERQARAFPNPMLSYAREQTSGAGGTASQNILSLEQSIEIGGQRGARRRSAELLRAVAEARMEAGAAGVDFEVKRSYAAAVAAQRRAYLADDAARAFAKAREVSKARLVGGDVSGYEDRRLALESARYATLRLAALVARDSAARVLASLIGIDDSVPPAIPPRLVDTLTPGALVVSVDSVVARALASDAGLRAARLESEAGLAEAHRANAERIPTPVLSGGFKTERLTTGETLNGFVLGVGLPVPLWNRSGGALDAARAEAARRSADAELLRRRISLEVRIAFEAHQALAEQLATLQARLGEDALKAHRSATVAYNEGEITLLEWLDGVRAYHEAESTYAELWSEYTARRAALERATGASLF